MSTELLLTVDGTADEPVYEQIARGIRAQIAAGALAPGTALPSVRILASDLGVNLNTVARAFRLLEEQGFVRIRDRAGAAVAAPRSSPDAASLHRLHAELREVLQRLRQAGVSPDEIRRLVDSAAPPDAQAR